ncbi:hypothetical protein Patl1_22972 [Pistacia atlantica]|uniref:Uncharacterized protein n=1 Tax=Pistacia atlantica TaxID=434234 RepID=A0ACC1A160_9ROSI|nr:hypothetical protein Patl1_22972 [Pistacia atlantica]
MCYRHVDIDRNVAWKSLSKPEEVTSFPNNALTLAEIRQNVHLPLQSNFSLEAIQGGTMEGFYRLISFFQTQSEPAYCGLASLSMVLNALAIDPGRKWKGPWRWFDESMLDCCEPLKKVKEKGISFGKLICLAHCAGAKVEAFRTNQSTIDDFRKYLIRCSSSDDCHLISSYHRGIFKQTGTGHFSPIGGYHAGRDMALILDVARFKYPPHWVPLSLLWEAMDSIDIETGQCRGFMLISTPHRRPGLLYTLSCKHESWVDTARYLMEDVPNLVKSKDFKDIDNVLSVVFASLPSNFGEFIKWVAEVRRQEDGDNSLSQEEKGRLAVKGQKFWQESLVPRKGFCCWETCVQCLKTDGDKPILVVSVTVADGSSQQGFDVLVPSIQMEDRGCSSSNFIRMYPAGNDILTVLLLALPTETWSGIKDEKLSQEIHNLVSTENLPTFLQEEVLHLRRQLHLLKRCQENKVDEDLAAPHM